MPLMPLPREWDTFLSRANPAVVATIRKDGSPHSVATWYDWKGGRIMLNMDPKRVRLEHIRRDPRVALTVFDKQDWEVHLSLLGRIVEIKDDYTLEDIDRLAMRYTTMPFGRRDHGRVTAWMEPERWHGWGPDGNLVPR
jgi:PPOX class probable F420-dependent enzyme